MPPKKHNHEKILELKARGWKNKEIAAHVGCPEGSISCVINSDAIRKTRDGINKTLLRRKAGGRMSEADEEVMSMVLADETTCRTMAAHLVSRGVTISVPLDSLTHEECAEFCLTVYSELARRELS